MTEPLWMPDARRTSATTLSAFRSWLAARTGQPPQACAQSLGSTRATRPPLTLT